MTRENLFWLVCFIGILLASILFFLPEGASNMVGYIIIFLLLITAFLVFFLNHYTMMKSGYKEVQIAYQKQYHIPLELSIRDKRTFTIIWDTVGYMKYNKDLYPFDDTFGDLFAAKDSKGIFEYVQERKFPLEDRGTMLQVLDIVYTLKQNTIDRWNQK